MEDITSALLLGHSSTSDIDHLAKTLILAAEANIARIDSQMRDLLRLRDRERGIIAVLKQVIAPIRKLPAELLVEIFRVVAAQAGKLSKPTFTSHALSSVLALSQVCAHWRQLACTTPQLWNYQVFLNFRKAPSDVYLATTKTFFERSAPLPIPILWKGETPKASPLIQVMLDSAPRWESLVFAESDISQLYRLPMDALKSLISLDLRHQAHISDLSPPKVFLGAHSLRTVRLTVRNMGPFHMPWSQLVELSLHVFNGEPAQEFLDILAQCTNIASVEFNGIVTWNQPPDMVPTPVVQLAQLTNLRLCFHSDDGFISPFIARLALPSLTKLSIYAGYETCWSPADITAFLRRSPNIEDLDISYSLMTSEDLSSLLLNSPSLVALHLSSCFNSDAAFESTLEYLTFSATALAHPAPRLQRLTISESMEDIDEEKLQHMISSRWWTDAQLAALPVAPPVARWEKLEICIHFDVLVGQQREYSRSLLAKVAQLQGQGLDVVID
ncbi:hypothetical protein FB45DRAFT_298158 [Roridomyces roridus]|uniref:F-box domain-containing protein n=1 Tax=Roridomyces roridus TaxID=1738132 RepID=A0AAD7CC29_9AGAR|nr:hypothetical protein FB45DRAFT_298158 [Roridomyces roridus]